MEKVPWYIVAPLSLLTIAILWHLRTKDMDFISAPVIEENHTLVRQPSNDHAPSSSSSSSESSYDEDSPDPKEASDSSPLSPLQIFARDEMNISHDLNAFKEWSLEHSATDHIELANIFENKEANQHALLVLERLIDTAEKTNFDLSSIESTITRLQEKTPPWNLDPEDSLTIQLNISTSATRHNVVREAAESAVAKIQTASGNTLTIIIKLSSPKAKLPNSPVAITFSSSDGEKMTSAFSSRPDSEEADVIKQTLYRSIYNVTKSHLNQSHDFKIANAPDAVQDHLPLLGNHFSRLNWLTLGQSLANKKEEQNETPPTLEN